MPEKVHVNTIATVTAQGVNVLQAQGMYMYQTSKGYISFQGMYRIYCTGSSFEVWL